MSATLRRSCSRTWRRRSPAKSFTSTRASATSSPGSVLLLLQISAVDRDARAPLEARDVRLVVRGALRLRGARLDLLLIGGGLPLHHLRDAQDRVALVRHRHAYIGGQLRGIGGDHLPQDLRRQALRAAARDRLRRAPGDRCVLALLQLLELRLPVL